MYRTKEEKHLIRIIKTNTKAMTECAKQEAIEFLKWIANFETQEEHGADRITLIDGNYYWDGDTDGDQPLSEEDLYKIFLGKIHEKV